jgi:hypothetical protein
MTWLVFGTGLAIGAVLGGLIVEMLHMALEYRERRGDKKLTFDRQIW